MPANATPHLKEGLQQLHIRNFLKKRCCTQLHMHNRNLFPTIRNFKTATHYRTVASQLISRYPQSHFFQQSVTPNSIPALSQSIGEVRTK
jgi:hypothetical protein